MVRIGLGAISLLLAASVARAQEGACGEGCGCDDGESVIEIAGEAGDEAIELEIDPFHEELPVLDEPNRPKPVQVGEWPAPALDDNARRELELLLAQRGETSAGAGVRYRLAEFYLRHGWFPQAELEFRACAKLDPESIRPWEGLLRVYRASAPPEAPDPFRVAMGLEVPPARRAPWLPSEAERMQRMAKAYEEILARRPDDLARRRELVAHLRTIRDYRKLAPHARVILEQLPDDAQTRYLLAEALRLLKPKELDEPIRLLEENARRAPDHAPSALRLARLLAVGGGKEAGDRVARLEERAFCALFVPPELMALPYRADTFRMARDLCGPAIANRLWDAAMQPPGYQRNRFGERLYYRRWIHLYFPHSMPRDRMRVVETLARRGDQAAMGTLLAFLWHAEEALPGPSNLVEEREADVHRRLIRAAVKAASGLGSVCYPPAERFWKAAKEPRHRRRAIDLLRALGDPRGVPPLLDALAYEIEPESSYGVAAALEELGDPRAVDGLVAAALDVRRPAARRREIIESLAAFQDARAVEAVSRLAKDPEFRIVAAYALFRLNGDEKSFAELREAVGDGAVSEEAMRLVLKCSGPRVEQILLETLEKGAPAARDRALAVLRERYWQTALPRVREILLGQSVHNDVSPQVLALLGEIGGKEGADRLLAIVEKWKGDPWVHAARALAETGDPRAVRYFNRMRILEKDEQRRKLAQKLHARAAARRATLDRAARE